MPNNQEVSKILFQLADYCELDGEGSFQLRAIRTAARSLLGYAGDIAADIRTKHVPGIGPSLTAKIDEFAMTGKIKKLEELKSQFPDLSDLTRVSGIGIKTAKKLHDYYKIASVKQLKEAIEKGTVKNEKWRAAIAIAEREELRLPFELVLRHATPILERVRQLPGVEEACFAGSVRRKRPTVKDVDILVRVADDAAASSIIESFCRMGNQTLNSGGKKASILILTKDIRVQIDLLCLHKKSWGAALNHFTGNKTHNIKLRALAKSRGIHVSEDGITRVSDGTWLGGEDEHDLYRILGLPYVEPEDREEADSSA